MRFPPVEPASDLPLRLEQICGAEPTIVDGRDRQRPGSAPTTEPWSGGLYGITRSRGRIPDNGSPGRVSALVLIGRPWLAARSRELADRNVPRLPPLVGIPHREPGAG